MFSIVTFFKINTMFYYYDANVPRCNPFLGAFENYFREICKKRKGEELSGELN